MSAADLPFDSWAKFVLEDALFRGAEVVDDDAGPVHVSIDVRIESDVAAGCLRIVTVGADGTEAATVIGRPFTELVADHGPGGT